MKHLISAFVTGGLLLFCAVRPAAQEKKTVSIRGRSLYRNGKIAVGARVTANPKTQLAGRVMLDHSDSEGHFEIPGLEPGKEYSVCASKQDEGHWDPYFLPFGLPSGGQCKDITAGQVSVIDVFLAPKGGTIEGQVLDQKTGKFVLNGKVIVYRPLKFLHGEWRPVSAREATFVPTAESSLDGDGHFKVVGLPSGAYFLKVEIPGRKISYFDSQIMDTAARSIAVRAGATRKLLVRAP